MKTLSRFYIFLIMLGIACLGINPSRYASSQSLNAPIVVLNNGDVWTYDLAADHWQQHTTDGFHSGLALSPDGEKVTFTGLDPEFLEFITSGAVVGDTLPSTELWLMK